MTGEKSAREDVWQMFTGMWFSTLVFLPIGIWLSYKAVTDSAVMSTETYIKIFNKLKPRNLIKKKEKDQELNT
jgi:lipopolysaccharide export system permease protein